MLDDLVERHDDKDSGNICMKLIGYIDEEADLTHIDNPDDYSALWNHRISLSRVGRCSYRYKCPIYKKTIAKYNATQQKLF